MINKCEAILAMCFRDQTIAPKLFADDEEASRGNYFDALDILNSYGFASDLPLLEQSLYRKAIYHALSERAGYGKGLRSIDSLRLFFTRDPAAMHFDNTYPLLYSGLETRTGGIFARKGARKPSYLVPSSIEVSQNYPNPFRGITSILFRLPAEGDARIVLYDALGRMVQTLAEGCYGAGTHAVELHADRLAAEIYFYRYQAGSESLIRKMVVLR